MSKEFDGFAPIYGVQLLFEKPPILKLTDLLGAIRRYRPRVQVQGDSTRSGPLLLLHPDHMVRLADGMIPAQTFISPADEPFEPTEDLAIDISQSWNFPEVEEVLGICRASVLVTDLMSSNLEYHQRLDLFQDVLAGLLEAIPAIAVHWKPAGQFVEPRQFLEAYHEGGSVGFFAGPFNIRFFNLEDSPGEVIMDTLGLSALGVPDLQCHFRGIEPNEIEAVLANTGYYLYENGDVIQDGNTIEGSTPGSRWICRHEESLLEPTRVVLDVDPGPPHVAGKRSSTR